MFHNGQPTDRDAAEDRKASKKLADELDRVQREKEELIKELKKLDNDHSDYHDKMQESYEQKIGMLQEELDRLANKAQEQEEYLNNNRQLRKENENLLKENRELKNFKENSLAENHPDKTKALLEEKDRRFKNLEILFNNEKENNELLKEKNRQLLTDNQILHDRAQRPEKDKENNEILQERIRQLQNENQGLKTKNSELETQRNLYSKDYPEKLTMLSTEISRLQFLLKEKDLQHEKELRDMMRDKERELREKDLMHEKTKQSGQPALKNGIVIKY